MFRSIPTTRMPFSKIHDNRIPHALFKGEGSVVAYVCKPDQTPAFSTLQPHERIPPPITESTAFTSSLSPPSAVPTFSPHPHRRHTIPHRKHAHSSPRMNSAAAYADDVTRSMTCKDSAAKENCSSVIGPSVAIDTRTIYDTYEILRKYSTTAGRSIQ